MQYLFILTTLIFCWPTVTGNNGLQISNWCSQAGLIYHSFFNRSRRLRRRYTKKFIKKIQCTWSALVFRKEPILLHDNDLPHVLKVTLQILNNLGYETLNHPPYSPDFKPTDFHLFKHLSNFLLKKCFKNQGDLETAFNEFVDSRNFDFYVAGINKLVSK